MANAPSRPGRRSGWGRAPDSPVTNVSSATPEAGSTHPATVSEPANPDVQEPVLAGPPRVAHVDAVGVDAAGLAAGRVEDEEVAGHHQAVAAQRLDDGDPLPGGRGGREPDLDLAR